MIVIVSNREVKKGVSDHTLFGDKPNQKGLNELRVAIAEFNAAKKSWKVNLLPEKSKQIKKGKTPTRTLFFEILKKINKGELKQDWVLFVHGFNQSFPDNLEKCKQIEKLYGVNVLAFSWPSNQGGLKLIEYKKARGASRGCTNAFDRMIEKLTEYLSLRDFTSKCEIRMSLMAYSLGNYVFENFVRSPIFSNETKIFDNIILTQADVDVETHAEWVGNLKYAKRVYVTINEDDRVLKWSDVPNPPRLGNTTKLLNAKNAVYFDFTNGKFVGSTHGLFYKTAKKNKVVKEIFQHALTGRRAERTIGIQYNTSTNAYELAEKAEKESTEWIHSAD